MSKQWGHGYWNGVNDALNGEVKRNIREQAYYWVCQMCIANKHKDYSKSLFEMTRFRIWCCVAGFSDSYAKRIYDYILQNEPYGCYVSGEAWTKWTEDCFVLPNNTEEYWRAEAESISKRDVAQ